MLRNNRSFLFKAAVFMQRNKKHVWLIRTSQLSDKFDATAKTRLAAADVTLWDFMRQVGLLQESGAEEYLVCLNYLFIIMVYLNL